MSTEGPERAVPARPWARLLLAVALALVAVAGGTAVALRSSASTPASTPTPVAAQEPVVAVPTAAVLGVTAGRVPWDAPLRVAVRSGRLTGVTALGPDGAPVPGTVTASGWTSSSTLLPATAYTLSASVRDGADRRHDLALTATTTPADRLLTAALSPGDDAVVGVGRTVEVRLDRDVTDPAAREAVEQRLSVRTRPAVEGAWRWMDDRTVHYRPAAFWAPGTRVDVRVDLQRLSLPGGVWGSGGRTTTFTVGDAIVSTIDVGAHTMTVRRNGRVLRVLPASMGKPEFATRNGTFVVLEKHRRRVMDSATVDLPPGTPAYRTAVEHAVRITNSGTFTHGAPWSVPDQGVRNVSHGCINLSPADAAWFYGLAKRGDVVQVVGSSRGANSWDAGSRDWNMSFADWQV